MNRILEQACEALCAALVDAAPQIKHAAPTQEVPDVPVDYPAIAVLPDHFDETYWAEEEVDDANGNPIVLDGSLALMECGSRQGSVRLFVAARSPSERSRIEDRIHAAFLTDDAATGRLLVQIVNLEVEGRATGASYPIAFLRDGEDWNEEMAFSAKRWTYLRLMVDVPILALRKDATPVTTAVVGLAAEPPNVPIIPVPTPSSPVADLEQIIAEADGTVGPTYP